MNDLLMSVGFTDKESKLYLFLIANGLQTAAAIAKATKESRTNTYMVLDKLVAKGVIVPDDSQPVRRFAADDPTKLQAHLQIKQREIVQAKHALDHALPELVSTFNLGQHKPGVVYLEGIKGLKDTMEDESKSKTDVLVWGSEIANQDPAIWKVIENGGYKKRMKGVKTRALFQEEALHWPHINEFKNKGFEVRVWGQKPFIGEVMIYDNKVNIRTLDPIINTVITNEVIADTFRTIFENCWDHAKPILSN